MAKGGSDIVLPGGAELPADAVRHCGGHVTGAPSEGRSGAHLSWEVNTSAEEPAFLAAAFADSIGRKPDSIEDGCSTWRFPPERPEAVLELCPGSATGPWSRECDPVPPEAASIILVSTMARAE